MGWSPIPGCKATGVNPLVKGSSLISGGHIFASKPTFAMALPRLKALFLALHLVAFGLARAIPLRRHSRAGGNPLYRRQSTWIPACAGMTTMIGPCIQTGRNGLLPLEKILKTFRTVPRKSTKNLVKGGKPMPAHACGQHCPRSSAKNL